MDLVDRVDLVDRADLEASPHQTRQNEVRSFTRYKMRLCGPAAAGRPVQSENTAWRLEVHRPLDAHITFHTAPTYRHADIPIHRPLASDRARAANKRCGQPDTSGQPSSLATLRQPRRDVGMKPIRLPLAVMRRPIPLNPLHADLLLSSEAERSGVTLTRKEPGRIPCRWPCPIESKTPPSFSSPRVRAALKHHDQPARRPSSLDGVFVRSRQHSPSNVA